MDLIKINLAGFAVLHHLLIAGPLFYSNAGGVVGIDASKCPVKLFMNVIRVKLNLVFQTSILLLTFGTDPAVGRYPKRLLHERLFYLLLVVYQFFWT